MKTKKIIDLCKDSNILTIYSPPDDIQWISDGYAIFPLEGFPKVTPATLCDMYDIPESKRKKMLLREEYTFPAGIDFDDRSAQKEVAPISVALRIAGNTHIPYLSNRGVAFVDTRYLAVYDTADQDYLQLYERFEPGGIQYFAIKIGMILSGIILPNKDILNPDFCADLSLLATACQNTLERAITPSASAESEADE